MRFNSPLNDVVVKIQMQEKIERDRLGIERRRLQGLLSGASGEERNRITKRLAAIDKRLSEIITP